MKEAEFDRFADEYEIQHKRNIAITGESPDFFAAYKILELLNFTSHLPILPAKILDFGSGIGNSVPFFRKFFPDALLICADASSRSIELSRKRFAEREHYALIAGREIPLEDNVFDVTFSACVFHHIAHEDHARWLTEMLRVTRPGGLLAIFEHNPLNPLTVRAVNTCPFDENAKLIRAKTLLKSIGGAGWDCPEVRYHLFFPRLLAGLRFTEKYLRWFPLGAQYSVTAQKP
jgi:SAM-dependent methyltransferase